MNISFIEESIVNEPGQCALHLKVVVASALCMLIALSFPASAQPVLFDFDALPVHSTLPVTVTVGSVTAHLSGTGSGYSIQAANVLGFTPPGFSGNIIYPNAITLADLLVKFDQTLTDFSIMYTVNELGCDTSATMRVTAYMTGVFVGTNTMIALFPGTWPVDTLKCSFPQGFDSVVVHYDKHPVACQDYGPNFMADNMWVTPQSGTAVTDPPGELPGMFELCQNYPNPFNPSTIIEYRLPVKSSVSLRIFDVLGREVATLVHGVEPAGTKSVNFDPYNLGSGVYYYRLQAGAFVETKKLLLLR